MNNIYLYVLLVYLTSKPVEGDQGNRTFLIEAVKQEKIEIINWLIGEEANVDIQDRHGKTPLMYAATLQNCTIVDKLINKGANADMTDGKGRMAIHYAAEYGRTEILSYLHDLELNISSADSAGNTALHLASAGGHVASVTYLLEQGEDPYTTNKDELTAVHFAAINGHNAVLTVFINNKINVDVSDYANGSTPLNVAALNNQSDTCKFLVESGALVDSHNKTKWSTLHSAAYSGNIDILELLIDRNASIEQVDNHGRSPLYIAVQKGDLTVTKFLIKLNSDVLTTDMSGNTLVHAAAYSGSIKLIKYLSSKKLLLDVKNNLGTTPLLIACLQGHLHLVKHFVRYQCNLNLVNLKGMTAMHAAAVSGNVDLIKYLIDQHVPLSSKDENVRTPLHLASYHGKLPIVKLIIETITEQHKNSNTSHPFTNINQRCMKCLKSEINIRDDEGKTPLYLAAETGNTRELKYLIDHGGDCQIIDHLGRSPFHAAAQNGKLSVMKLLILQNINVDLKDNNGQTPLYLSVDSEQIESYVFLVDIGADSKLKDNLERTVIHAAADKGNTDILKLITQNQEMVKLIDAPDKTNKSPAWYATNKTHLTSLSILINLGAQITDDLFKIAISNGDLDAVRALVWNGADVNMKTKDGESILEYASHQTTNAIDIIHYLIESGANLAEDQIESILQKSIEVGNFKLFNYLRTQKYFKNNDYYKLLLRKEFERNNMKTVKYLVDNKITKIDSRYPDINNATLLHIAARNGSVHTFDFLILNGLSINATDEQGNKPIDYAIQRDQVSAFEYFIKMDPIAYANLTNQNDFIKLAAESGSLKIIKYLFSLDIGDELPSKKINGKNLLHLAVKGNSGELIDYLIDAGVNKNGEDSDGNRPLHLAVHYKNSLIALLKKSVEIDETNKMGYTALKLAYEANRFDIGECLVKYDASTNIEYDRHSSKGGTWRYLLERRMFYVYGGRSKSSLVCEETNNS